MRGVKEASLGARTCSIQNGQRYKIIVLINVFDLTIKYILK